MTGRRAKENGRRKGAKDEGDGKVDVRTPNVPGYSGRVDAAKYGEMKRALLKVLPKRAPGLTQAEMFEAVLAHLSEERFPGGATAAWWVKCVQLDLEAQGVLQREATKPLRWRKA